MAAAAPCLGRGAVGFEMRSTFGLAFDGFQLTAMENLHDMLEKYDSFGG